ncbi:MAG: hypothetical protein DLM58_18000 [Pseudonocardiales bacterium]|nr:MAG: hypothetical protein DLM58_18000 [Pseudonocardiales bacterium]
MPNPPTSGRPATATSTVVPRRYSRLFGVAQLGLGVLLALRPEHVAASAAGPSGRPAPRWLVRVLGMRSMLQGAVTAGAPTTVVLLGGALIDATHAASMTPLIAASPRYRRAATISAFTAGISAAVGTMIASRHRLDPGTAT